jgi:hypothetical protein
MKKLLLSMLALASFTAANDQIIWQENFEATVGSALPAGFTQTTLATDGGWKTGIASGLSSQNFPFIEHSRFIATNDDACNCDKSNDLLKTPSMNLSGYASGVYLQYDLVFAGGTYQGATETAEIQYSLNGGTTWTQLGTIAGNTNNAWVTRAVLLPPAVLGQSNVMLAFKYNDGGGWLFAMALDNIKVLVPPAKDAGVSNAFSRKYINNAPVFTATVANWGSSPLTSVTLNYQIGANPAVSQNFPISPALNYTQSQQVSFNPATLTVGNYNNLKIWVSDVNGTGPDANLVNDTSTFNTYPIYVASQSVSRNALIEEFTSSTCPPCASLNVTFDPLLNSNNPNTGSRVNVVKYQMNWPSPGNDPSYNPDGLARRNFYGVSGIPDAYANGRTRMSTHDQAEIDAAKAESAFADMTATLTKTGNTFTANLSITPYVTVPTDSRLAVYQAIMQDHYTYPGASTTQKEYYHPMRKMLPNGNGKMLSTLTSGTAITSNDSYTFNAPVGTPTQGSYDLWNGFGKLEYVAFVQDTVTGDVLQSVSASIALSLVELSENQQIGLYPNPANDFSVVAVKFNSETKVSLAIVDMSGKIIYKKDEATIPAGQQEIAINTSNFPTGTYSVIVKTPYGDMKEKLVVQH